MLRSLSLFVLLLIPFAPTGVAPGQNDAGSGQDAPGTFAEAMAVSPGDHWGSIDVPAGDAEDWYRLADPPCGGFYVRFRSWNWPIYAGIYDDATGELLAQALASGGEQTLGIDASIPVRIGFGPGPSADDASFAYSFYIGTGSQPDAGNGCDGGPERARAVRVDPGHHQGRINPQVFDRADWFYLQTPDCSVVRLTMTSFGAPLDAEIYDAHGERLATGRSGGDTLQVVALTGKLYFGFLAPQGSNRTAYQYEPQVVSRGDFRTCVEPDATAAVAASLPADP